MLKYVIGLGARVPKLSRACYAENDEIFDYLLSLVENVNTNAIHTCVVKNRLDYLQKIKARGFTIDTSAIITAAENGMREIVLWCIEHQIYNYGAFSEVALVYPELVKFAV